MRRLAVAIAFMLVLSLFISPPSRADNANLDFSLVNKTGYGIKGVYIAPSDSDDWGDNVIKETFNDGESLSITFSPKATAASWDLRIEWEDNDPAVVWKGYKLESISKITLHYNKSTGETSAETE